ncbi:MAG: response regulator [Bacteroidia bacterium]
MATKGLIYRFKGKVAPLLVALCNLVFTQVAYSLNSDSSKTFIEYQGYADREIANGNYSLALKQLLEARENFLGTKDEEALLLLNIASLYVKEDNLKSAQKYLYAANEIAEREASPYVYLTKGRIALAKQQFSIAYENTLKSLVFLQEIGDSRGEIEVYELLSKIYYKQQKFKQSLLCARQYLQKSEGDNLVNQQIDALNILALDYARVGKLDSAKIQLEKAELLSVKTGLYQQVQVIETKFSLSEIMADTKSALIYYKQYLILRDSLVSTNKEKEIAELEAIKENEKQKEVNAILVEKAINQESELERKELEKKIYLIGLVLFILFGILAVYSLIRARVANKKLLKLTHDIKQSRDKIKKTSEKLKQTNRKLVKIQAALISQKDAAERASTAKDTFLSSVTHELRTPLTAILGLSEEMLGETYDSKTRENVEIIKFSGENLLSLVNDILDYNKIQSGRIELEHISFNLKGNFEKLIKALKPRARQNRVELLLDYDDNLPEYFIADPVRIGQVINNFLSNAIKFTQNGKVWLKVKCLSTENGQYKLRVMVKDQGIGIEEEKLGMIFERFTQASADTTRKYGGTGLGLAISKRIVELYGSRVQVQSKLGKGSIFFFDISLEEGEKNIESVEEDFLTEVPSEINILVVEDNKINQKLIAKTFSTIDIEIDIANNGQEALDILKLSKKEYDIVLMDMHMPIMDGEQATKEIRRSKGYLAHIPIVGLSGSTIKEDHELAEMGLNAFMQKPFKRDELLKLVARQIIQA